MRPPLHATAERVAAGAALLDEKDPGWWRADADPAIHLDELEMHNGQQCVLGQRCPREIASKLGDGDISNYLGYSRLLSGLDSRVEIDQWGARHGFDIGYGDEFGDSFDSLAAEWARVITERRAAA